MRHARLALAALAGVGGLALAGCASEPTAYVPADLARAPCRPAAELMLPAEPLPKVAVGDNLFEMAADYARRYRALARKDGDLIKSVQGCA